MEGPLESYAAEPPDAIVAKFGPSDYTLLGNRIKCLHEQVRSCLPLEQKGVGYKTTRLPEDIGRGQGQWCIREIPKVIQRMECTYANAPFGSSYKEPFRNRGIAQPQPKGREQLPWDTVLEA